MELIILILFFIAGMLAILCLPVLFSFIEGALWLLAGIIVGIFEFVKMIIYGYKHR